MKQPLSLLPAALAALALAAAPARASSRPQGALDECYGKPHWWHWQHSLRSRPARPAERIRAGAVSARARTTG